MYASLVHLYVKVKKYKKTSRATSNVGYQTNVVFESVSSSALEFLAHSLCIYFANNLFIYLFCVVIKYFTLDKVNSSSYLL